MPESDPIDFPTEADKRTALEQFDAEMRAAKARLQLVSREELNAVLSTLTDYLRSGWTTGGSRRLRHFVWSLWNGSHLVNFL
jgi:hypothetical protein